MNNTRFLSFFQWVLLAILALALSGCSNSESNTAEINIKIPASFLNQDNSGIAAQAVSGKPDNISRIIITVSGSKNELYYSGDIVAAGGSLSLEVPAFTDLTVSGFAYAGQTLKYKGYTAVPALKPGSRNGISLTLSSVEGTGGSIVIDMAGPINGTVNLVEVDNSGNTVGQVRATATVSNGQFALKIPAAIVPDSHYVIRANINGEILESRYVDINAIEISPLSHAVSRLVNELAALTEGGLADIRVQEILEIQKTLGNVKNLYGSYDPNGELTLDAYADELIRVLKSDIETSAVATSAIAANEICGRVVDSNQMPQAGISIEVRDFATFLLSARTTTGADGRYCVNVPAAQQADPFTNSVASGEYIVGAINLTNTSGVASQWWTANGSTKLQIDAGKLSFSEGSLATADFTLPPGARIQGKIVASGGDHDGQPLPGIRVLVHDGDTQLVTAATTTDMQGNYRVNVAAGEYVLQAQNNTDQQYAGEIYDDNGGSNNLNLGKIFSETAANVTTADFVLDVGSRIVGLVKDNGEPVTGQPVEVNLFNDSAATRLLISQVDGSFQVWLRNDIYDVAVYGQIQSYIMLNGEDAVLDFAATPSAVPVNAVFDDRPASKMKFQLLYYDIEALAYLPLSSGVTKSDGTLTLYSAYNGNNQLVARVDSAQSYASTVYNNQLQQRLGSSINISGQSQPLRIVRVPVAGVLTGTAVDGASPLANAKVTVRYGGTTSDNDFVSTFTRGDGRFTLSLPAGFTYDTIQFDSSAGTYTCSNVQITAGATTTINFDASQEILCSAATQAGISGGWGSGDTQGGASLVFLPNGTFVQAQDGVNALDGMSGIRRGTYTWNPITGEFASFPDLDTASDPDTLRINNDSLSASFAGNAVFQLPRVTDLDNPVVGSWVRQHPTGADLYVLTLFANGTFMLATDGSESDSTCLDGIERGSYTFDAASGAFNANADIDTNGECGFGNTGSNQSSGTLTIRGDTAIYVDGESIQFYSRANRYTPKTSVSGIVKDALSNQPLAGVNVTVTDALTGLFVNGSTSNLSGEYSIAVTPDRDYVITFAHPSYISATYNGINVTAGSNLILQPILQINNDNSGYGDIAGMVIDANTGQGVAAANVCLRSGINTTTGDCYAQVVSDDTGNYVISEVIAGNYTLEFSATGYSTAFSSATALGGQTIGNQNGTISRLLNSGELRIVLTWGATPSDLDSHLTGDYTDTTGRFHVYYSNTGSLTGDPYASLDVDDTSSYGPETITIAAQNGGLYRYSVYDYTNGGLVDSVALSNSGAQVNVFDSSGLIATYNVPPNQTGDTWTVFEMTGGVITPVNTISATSGGSSSVLSVGTTTSTTDAAVILGDLVPK